MVRLRRLFSRIPSDVEDEAESDDADLIIDVREAGGDNSDEKEGQIGDLELINHNLELGFS